MPHSNKDNRHPVLHLSVEQTKFTSRYTNLTHNFLDQFSCSLNLTFVASNSYSSFLRCLPFRYVLQYHLKGRKVLFIQVMDKVRIQTRDLSHQTKGIWHPMTHSMHLTLATWMRAPDFVWRFLMFSPPFPMINPTWTELHIYHRWPK